MRINENNYVDKAEEAIKSLVEESKQKCRGKVNIVTTSKIRNLLAMTDDIYNQVPEKSADFSGTFFHREGPDREMQRFRQEIISRHRPALWSQSARCCFPVRLHP